MANTMRKNTDAGARGGVARSSEEASLMEVERRGGVILPTGAVNLRDSVTSAKPYGIAKRTVWEAYQQ